MGVSETHTPVGQRVNARRLNPAISRIVLRLLRHDDGGSEHRKNTWEDRNQPFHMSFAL
jgi:hypothetical protein